MNLLEVSKADKEFVRAQLQLKEEDIKRDVEILKEWIKKEPHLPQGVQEDAFFENFLIRCKGRVEKAKQSIDSYYTVKIAWPEVYDRLINDIKPSMIPYDLYPILELNENKERIIFGRLWKSTAETYTDLQLIKNVCAFLEVLHKYDYCTGLHVVMDVTDFRMDLLKLVSPSLIKKMFSAFTEVYSYRFLGYHLYNPPSWIGLFLNLIKPVMKKKIYERVCVHYDIDSLLKKIPIESIPSEYGGKQPSFEELKVKWENILEDHKEYLEEVEKLKSNERLRVGKQRLDVEIFGVNGTFKRLNLD